MLLRLLFCALLVLRAHANIVPSVVSGPTATFSSSTGAVTVSVTVTGQTTSDLTIQSCSTGAITSPANPSLTKTVAQLVSPCGFTRLDCSSSNSGACTGFNGTYLYTGTLLLTAVNGPNQYQLFAGQLNVLVPVHVNVQTTTNQTWISLTSNTSTSVTSSILLSSTVAFAGTAPPINEAIPLGSIIAFQVNITSALPVAYQTDTSITTSYCSNAGASSTCISESAVWWDRTLVGPLTTTQITSGGPGAVGLDPFLPYQLFYIFVQFPNLPSPCQTFPADCFPGLLTMTMGLTPNITALPSSGRRLLQQQGWPNYTIIDQVEITIVVVEDNTTPSRSGYSSSDWVAVSIFLVFLLLFGAWAVFVCFASSSSTVTPVDKQARRLLGK